MVNNQKKLHQIKSNIAGHLGNTDNKTWKEFVMKFFDSENSDLDWNKIATRKCLDKELVLSSVKNIIKKIEQTKFIDHDYSLLHTDFNQRNLFVNPETNEIAGIIDWSEAMFGDPLYDFARIRMYIWHFNLGEKVLEDYYKLMNYTSEQKELEELYWLTRVIEYLAWYSEDLNEFNVGRIKLHLEFLREYKWKT